VGEQIGTMRKVRKTLLTLAALGTGVALILCAWWVLSKRTFVFPSPDGTMALQATTDNDSSHIVVSIHDAKGHTIFSQDTRASALQGWNVRWASDARIILNSSDVGCLGWTRQSDGSWREDSPLRKLSPDGRLVLYTHWGSCRDKTVTVTLLEGKGGAEDATSVVWESGTDLRVDDLADCATWDSASQFTIHGLDGDLSWALREGRWEKLDTRAAAPSVPGPSR
jgi:hypothetical protein